LKAGDELALQAAGQVPQARSRLLVVDRRHQRRKDLSQAGLELAVGGGREVAGPGKVAAAEEEEPVAEGQGLLA
jgi:hypothetical protein